MDTPFPLAPDDAVRRQLETTERNDLERRNGNAKRMRSKRLMTGAGALLQDRASAAAFSTTKRIQCGTR